MSQSVKSAESTEFDGAISTGGATIPRAGQLGLGVARILLGWVFLWAFLDKLFGLGLGTPAERAWISGSSATAGYLSGVEGPFAGMFAAMAGNALVDWLFMVGMAGVGIAFLLGVAMLPAAVAGLLLMGGIYLSMLPLATNPFLDQHLFYVVLGFAFALAGTGRFLGLGRWWSGLPIIKNSVWLR